MTVSDRAPWDVESFSERMQRCRDTIAEARRVTGAGRVDWNRRAPVNVAGAAELLQCSVQRVRKLLAQRRIERARKVKGEWRIPVQADGLPSVLTGTRGPSLRVQEAEYDEVPF